MALHSRIIIPVLIAVLLLTACQNTQPGPQVVTVITSAAPTAAPAKGTVGTSPLVSPLSPVATAVAIDTPVSGTGTVHGKLLTEGTGKPYAGTLFLGHTIPSNQPNFGPMISLSEDTDPKADVNPDTGSFEFTRVPPGTYALVLWSPVGDTPITKSDGKDYLVFEVQPDAVVELGVVNIR